MTHRRFYGFYRIPVGIFVHYRLLLLFFFIGINLFQFIIVLAVISLVSLTTVDERMVIRTFHPRLTFRTGQFCSCEQKEKPVHEKNLYNKRDNRNSAHAKGTVMISKGRICSDWPVAVPYLRMLGKVKFSCAAFSYSPLTVQLNTAVSGSEFLLVSLDIKNGFFILWYVFNGGFDASRFCGRTQYTREKKPRKKYSDGNGHVD